MSTEDLYDKAKRLVDSNEVLYDQWENEIAAYMSKKWPDAFAETRDFTGSDHVTLLEVASMGSDHVGDHEKFLGALKDLFRSLAKGNSLNSKGEWS